MEPALLFTCLTESLTLRPRPVTRYESTQLNQTLTISSTPQRGYIVRWRVRSNLEIITRSRTAPLASNVKSGGLDAVAKDGDFQCWRIHDSGQFPAQLSVERCAAVAIQLATSFCQRRGHAEVLSSPSSCSAYCHGKCSSGFSS